MAYLENVGRSILSWGLAAATCACRRNEETGSLREKEFGIFEKRTG